MEMLDGRDWMIRYERIFLIMLLCLIWPLTVLAADGRTQISSLRVSDSADKIRIVLNTADSVVKYKQMSLTSPDRLVVDIENAWIANKDKTEKNINSRFAEKVRVAQFNEKTVRVVIQTKMRGHNVNIFTLDKPNRLVIDLGNLKRSSGGLNIDIGSGKPKSSTEKKTQQEKISTESKQSEREKADTEEKQSKKETKPAKVVKPAPAPKPAADDDDDSDDDYFGRGQSFADDDDDDDNQEEKPQRKPFEFIRPERRDEADYSDTDRAIADLTGLKGRIIAIDPGHGGSDPGAIGPTGVTEKSVALRVSLELRKLLEKEGAKVYMTRTKDTEVSPKGRNATDIEELQARCDVANRCKADIFVSIHMDSFTNGEARGTTGYYYTEGSAKSRSLADKIRAGIIEQIHTVSRGTQPRNLYVVKHTDMPATLVEVAFISNREEEKLMNSDEGVKKAAQGIADGIADYFG